MKNITVSVDDETYRRARVKAAEQDTSLSALVRQFLVGLAMRVRPNGSCARSARCAGALPVSGLRTGFRARSCTADGDPIALSRHQYCAVFDQRDRRENMASLAL
jgi:hypothetical protein